MAEVSDRVGASAFRLRQERGESLREVAKRAGLSQMQLSRVERLESDPTEEKIRGLAAALGVSVAVLFGEEQEAAIGSRVNQILRDARLPSTERALAERMIVSVADTICRALKEELATTGPVIDVERTDQISQKGVVLVAPRDVRLWLKQDLPPEEEAAVRAAAWRYAETHAPSNPDHVVGAVLDGQHQDVIAEFSGPPSEVIDQAQRLRLGRLRPQPLRDQR